MRIVVIAVLFALSAACAGDVQSPAAPSSITVPVRITATAGASTDLATADEAGSSNIAALSTRHLRSHMTGAEEVPVRDTAADGDATFILNKGGTELSFTLNVDTLNNVNQAHIHLAPVGVNGGIVVWLYPAAPPATLIPGTTNGELSSGTITQSSLVGALAGRTLNDLLAEMRAGNAYVNVHTTLFPAGEIRGQVRRCLWVVAGC